ncbi:MAG TPA: hypothetical protein PKH77_24740 [Anaerolineae bacterium]|nr:hypothetical protein [Anaerolineae bacterium]
MAKKWGLSITLMLVLVLGIVGMVAAQDTPPATETPCPFNGECPYGNAGMQGAGNGGMHGYRGTMPDLMAEALGMTAEDLLTAANAGQTVAQIAEAQGVELAAVADALVAPRAEWLDQAVAEGALTREQADEMLATMTAHMLENLTAGKTLGGGMGGNGQGRGRMGGNGQGNGGMRGQGRGNGGTPQFNCAAP